MKEQELKAGESPLDGAIEYLESLKFDTCCSGRDCGCMGKPIDPEYYMLQDLYKAKAQLARKDQIIAELKRSNDFYADKIYYLQMDLVSIDRWGTVAGELNKELSGEIFSDGGKLAREVAKRVKELEEE